MVNNFYLHSLKAKISPMKVIVFLFILLTTISLKAQNDSTSNNLKQVAEGDTILPFLSKLLNGKYFNTAQHKGKVMLINFWYIGCKPCIGEIIDLNKVYSQFKDSSNFTMISLALNSEKELKLYTQNKNRKWFEKIKYPILPNCKAIANKYGITGYPTTIIVDQNGIVNYILSGATKKSLMQYAELYQDKELKAFLSVPETFGGPFIYEPLPDLNIMLSEKINKLLKNKTP